MNYEVTAPDDVIKNLWQQKTAMIASGGFVIDLTTIDTSAVEYLEKGALLALDWSTHLANVVKTAIVISGGSASAPRVGKNHIFKAGDIISDGQVAVGISSITTTETGYDVLTLDGSLEVYAADTVLVEAKAKQSNNSESAIATVEEVSTKYLAIADPSGLNNGVKVVLEQAADDNLAVAFADMTLTISLADTTGAKNTAALIEDAIQALAFINGIVDFTSWTATGTNWTTITGGTITTESDITNGGRVATIQEMHEAEAFGGERVKLVGEPNINAVIGVLEIKESELPYSVSDLNKTSLGDRFYFI